MSMTYLSAPGIPTVKKLKLVYKPEEIEKAVCKYYGLSGADLRTKCRKQVYVLPRQMFYYLGRIYCTCSILELAYYLGRHEHTIVINSCDAMKDRLSTSAQTRQELQDIKHYLSYNL